MMPRRRLGKTTFVTMSRQTLYKVHSFKRLSEHIDSYLGYRFSGGRQAVFPALVSAILQSFPLPRANNNANSQLD